MPNILLFSHKHLGRKYPSRKWQGETWLGEKWLGKKWPGKTCPSSSNNNTLSKNSKKPTLARIMLMSAITIYGCLSTVSYAQTNAPQGSHTSTLGPSNVNAKATTGTPVDSSKPLAKTTEKNNNSLTLLWDAYDNILKHHVSDGTVDYQGLAQSQPFKHFMARLRQHKPADNYTAGSDKHSATQHQKTAFFINVYNALTLELITNNMPLESIKDIGGWFSSPWKIDLFAYQGQLLNLNDIEHKILRKLGEPRIHFAINCASISCPVLRNEAYRAGQLDTQLQEQQWQFINSPLGVQQVDGTGARVSKIFDWFEEDWGAQAQILHLIRSNHAKGQQIQHISGYLPYNWQLNEAK